MKNFLILLVVWGLTWAYMVNTPLGIAKRASKVGFVKVARGDVKIKREGKLVKKIKKSMKLYEGDEISTGKKSLLTMYMKDGSAYTVPEKSKLVLEKYEADKKKRDASFKLMIGKLRGVVKSVQSKKPNVVIKTPSAVAGIRGTDVFIEVAKDRKSKNGENKKKLTRVACLEGNCLTGAIKDKKKSSAILNLLSSLFEGTAFAATDTVEMAQVPAGTAVSVKKGMSLENILGTAKKVPASLKQKIVNTAPASDKEHASAVTNNALAIDASDSSNLQTDIDAEAGTEDVLAALIEAEDATSDLKPKEIQRIIGTTRVTITIDLSGI